MKKGTADQELAALPITKLITPTVKGDIRTCFGAYSREELRAVSSGNILREISKKVETTKAPLVANELLSFLGMELVPVMITTSHNAVDQLVLSYGLDLTPEEYKDLEATINQALREGTSTITFSANVDGAKTLVELHIAQP